MAQAASQLSLTAPPRFDLSKAVCGYGFFLLAPTHWDNTTHTLRVPLRGEDDRIIHAAVTHPTTRRILRIRCDRKVNRPEAQRLRAAIRRMLRLEEDFTRWFKLHPCARREGYGRLFRSPTFFEDVVKTMTTCNIAWPNTVRMNALLCEEIGGGAFPTPAQLSRRKPATLKLRCRVGYRAEWIVRFARQIDSGALEPAWFENPSRSTEELYSALRGIQGLGEYAAHNVLQLLGRYDRLPIDSETVRHFRQVHGVELPENTRLRREILHQHYKPFSPFQFLAYWYELKNGYEAKAGPAERWNEADMRVFSANLNTPPPRRAK